MEFIAVQGSSVSLLYFYLTVGRKVGGTWTDYTGMIAAFQVGSDIGGGGTVPLTTDNYVLATNMAGDPYTVISAGSITTIENAGASNLTPTTFIPGGNQGTEYDLQLFWESLSAIAGDDLEFWVPNMQEVRAKFHYTQAGGGSSAYSLTFSYPWKFSCKP